MDICEKYRRTGRIVSGDLKTATEDELCDLKTMLDANIAEIEMSINLAKAKVITDNQYSEPLWFHKAILAKRIKGQLSQRIQTELGKRKKERARLNREIYSNNTADLLFNAIKLVLPLEQQKLVIAKFSELKEKANQNQPNSNPLS